MVLLGLRKCLPLATAFMVMVPRAAVIFANGDGTSSTVGASSCSEDTLSTGAVRSVPNVTLANGVEMPQLALGTAPLIISNEERLPHNQNFKGFLPERTYRSLTMALEAGIRHIDTALVYRSHCHVAHVLGEAFAAGKLTREDVFVTSKVYHGPNDGFGTDDSIIDMENMSPEEVSATVKRHVERTLDELGLGYVDLLLLHWPAKTGSTSPLNSARRLAAWKVLEQTLDKGWARAIGVSNFSELHLEQLMDDGAVVRPMVNQIEASVYLQRTAIMDYCKNNGIFLQAYSPLGRGVNEIVNDPVIGKIGRKHGRDPGQVAMRYLIQRGFAVTFLSLSADRLLSNKDIFAFELEDDEMSRLDALNKPDGTWGLCSPYDMS